MKLLAVAWIVRDLNRNEIHTDAASVIQVREDNK